MTLRKDPNADNKAFKDRVKLLLQTQNRISRQKRNAFQESDPTFITFLWNRFGSKLGPAHVHALRDMVAKGYGAKHRFVCVTDDPNGLDCETYPLWPDHGDVKNPYDGKLVSCYRRLKLFSEWAEVTFGPRRISLDLDCVITGNIKPLFDRNEPFVGWEVRGTNQYSVYQGSIWMIQGSTHRAVWDCFDPIISPKLTNAAGFGGTDQAWMSMFIGQRASWTNLDGIYNWKTDLVPRNGNLPPSRIVFFPGENGKPWQPLMRELHPWIKEFYPWPS